MPKSINQIYMSERAADRERRRSAFSSVCSALAEHNELFKQSVEEKRPRVKSGGGREEEESSSIQTFHFLLHLEILHRPLPQIDSSKLRNRKDNCSGCSTGNDFCCFL